MQFDLDQAPVLVAVGEFLVGRGIGGNSLSPLALQCQDVTAAVCRQRLELLGERCLQLLQCFVIGFGLDQYTCQPHTGNRLVAGVCRLFGHPSQRALGSGSAFGGFLAIQHLGSQQARLLRIGRTTKLVTDIRKRPFHPRHVARSDGTLHLVGYDHMDDAAAAAMEALEVKALASLGIANPYADQD